jgi:hypothetical protein
VAKWDGSSWACSPDVDTDTLASLACRGDEIAKWNGSFWTCAEDDDRLGGLSCSGLDQVIKWNGSSWACAWDDDTTYSFGPGLTIDNGQVVVDPAAFSLRTSTVASSGVVGERSSLAIGADGFGLISYLDVTDNRLGVAKCLNANCSSATVSRPGSAGNGGAFSSLAVGADGLGIIAFKDGASDALMVAHCVEPRCRVATFESIPQRGLAGWYISLALGVDGRALVSNYLLWPLDDLDVVHLPLGS